MNKFIISFDYQCNIINLELMLSICNYEMTQLVRVYIDKVNKKIKLYVEFRAEEKILYEKIKLYSIYECNIVKATEENLLYELSKTDMLIYEMQYMYDIYNIFMLKKMCN